MPSRRKKQQLQMSGHSGRALEAHGHRLIRIGSCSVIQGFLWKDYFWKCGSIPFDLVCPSDHWALKGGDTVEENVTKFRMKQSKRRTLALAEINLLTLTQTYRQKQISTLFFRFFDQSLLPAATF